MGIFSLFGKKNERKEHVKPEKRPSKKVVPEADIGAPTTTMIDEGGGNSLLMQKHIARATERKIDAIEYEMSRDIVKSKIAAFVKPAEVAVPTTVPVHGLNPDFASTLPLQGTSTDFLIQGGHTDLAPVTITASEPMPVLEEAAILYASGQTTSAEQLLLGAIKQDRMAQATEAAWLMLFDLYQIERKQPAFESLSLDYAHRFEMSPPHWVRADDDPDPTTQILDDATPTLVFPQVLDVAVTTVLEKSQTLSQKSKSIRLDLTRVRRVDPVGCALLLKILQNLRKAQRQLVLVGAQELNQKIRAILQVGRRDETEAPWLLLLEILQLLHFEREFEEVSMDYCVTFEVSPPPFAPPERPVTTSFPEITLVDDTQDRYLLPATVEGKLDGLIKDIRMFAADHPLVLLDCTKLQRLEFGASAQLLGALAQLSAQKGIRIQFHDVNYLVMFLLHAMGYKNVATIFPRRH